MQPDDGKADDDDVSILSCLTEQATAIMDNRQVSLDPKVDTHDSFY